MSMVLGEENAMIFHELEKNPPANPDEREEQQCTNEEKKEENEREEPLPKETDVDEEVVKRFGEPAEKGNGYENSLTREIPENLENSPDFVSEAEWHEAIVAGDGERVASMIARGFQNLDEPDWNVTGDPPLLVAATNHHSLSVLGVLLENGCNSAARSLRGETALHRVVSVGCAGKVFSFVEKLLKHGCPAGVKEASGGLTALHIFVRQLSHAQFAKGIKDDFEEALKTLDVLAKASPVNAKDHQGRTSLHLLATSTSFDKNKPSEIEQLVNVLLQAGANPATINNRGETALHAALESGTLNIASILIPVTPVNLPTVYGETSLHIVCRKNYVDLVRELLDLGEDPSWPDISGNTSLHLAAARGFHRIVQRLVTSPLAQLEKVNNEGMTALDVATESGFANAVEMLLRAGAECELQRTTSTLRRRQTDITDLIDHELSRRRLAA